MVLILGVICSRETPATTFHFSFPSLPSFQFGVSTQYLPVLKKSIVSHDAHRTLEKYATTNPGAVLTTNRI